MRPLGPEVSACRPPQNPGKEEMLESQLNTCRHLSLGAFAKPLRNKFGLGRSHS